MSSDNTSGEKSGTSGPVGPRRIPARTDGAGKPGKPGKAGKPARASEGGHRGRWIVAAVVALVLIAGAVAFALVQGLGENDGESDDARIRAAIGTFTTALRDGDLATLRTVTCGPLGTFYAGIADPDFAAVHEAAVASRTIPEVDSIDAITVTEPAEGSVDTTATAIAQVTARTDPAGVPSVRTFDLAHEGEDWKVCA